MQQNLEERFTKTAELLPHMIDIVSDQVLLSRLPEAAYHKASFLDQRIITPDLPREAVPWKALDGIHINQPPPDFIFHIGHVGSTLISRLLDESPRCLAIREPHILRTFAELSQIKGQAHAPWSPEQYDLRLSQVIGWFSRSFYKNQRPIIKASSFVSEIAADLIGPSSKALFLYVALPKYMETIMAGDGSRNEAGQLAGARLVRLNALLGTDIARLWELSHVQRVTLGWLCEMVTLMQASKKHEPSRIRWQDFDGFLAAPENQFAGIADFFALGLSAQDIDKILSGPIMSRYSKAPEHDYSPDLRQQLLNQARREFGSEMQHATEWVLDLADKHALIAEIITFSEKG